MQILALDTSTAWLSVAIYDGHSVNGLRERAGSAASERVLPLVEQLLASAQLSLSQLAGIAYGAGPGSFTGVRVACGVVQGLALGADLPVYGVSSLSAVAHGAFRAHGWRRVLACLDARMREVYLAAYVRDDNGWTRMGDAQVLKPRDVVRPDAQAWQGAGDGFAAYPDLALQLQLADVDAALFPDAQDVAQCAWPHLLNGEGRAAADAEPIYVRHRVALTTAERAAGLRL